MLTTHTHTHTHMHTPGLPGPPGPPGARGITYIRWGRRTCPSTANTLRLYEGITVGSHWSHAGSASYLCLHQNPQFLRTTRGMQPNRATLYGTEYQMIDTPPALSSLNGHDTPCSACYSSGRSAKIMIPGRTECTSSSWTREYYGYLMTDRSHVNHRSRVPVCVDVNAEAVAGGASDRDHSLLYFTETSCDGIRCPPYFLGSEITCVVCTI